MSFKIILLVVCFTTLFQAGFGDNAGAKNGVDVLFVLSARELPADDDITGGKPDPYVKMTYYSSPTSGAFEYSTAHIDDTHNPVWPEVFHATFVDGQKQRLFLTIWDKDFATADDEMGKVEISLKEIVEAKHHKIERPIIGNQKRNGYLVIDTMINKMSDDKTDTRILRRNNDKVINLGRKITLLAIVSNK